MKTAGKLVEDESDSEILKEVEGIGTEATRSGIIETIKKNGYIEVKKNIVSVTEKGKILCKAIEGNLLSSPAMTAKWESYLKKIGEGKGSQENFLKNIRKFLNATIEQAPEKIKKTNIDKIIQVHKEKLYIADCPSCEKGKIIDHKTFFGCTGYSNGCKFTINKKIAGKTLTKKNILDLIEKGKTSKIKGFKSKKGGNFEAILKLNIKDNKIKFDFN